MRIETMTNRRTQILKSSTRGCWTLVKAAGWIVIGLIAPPITIAVHSRSRLLVRLVVFWLCLMLWAYIPLGMQVLSVLWVLKYHLGPRRSGRYGWHETATGRGRKGHARV